MKYGSGLQYGTVDPTYTPLEGQDILYENTTTGDLWHFNTLTSVWECLSCASGSGVTLGNFNVTGVPKGLSLTGTDLALHSASATTPGAVDLVDNQVLGDNTKIFQKNTSADAATIILRNNNAVSPNMGSAISFENGGLPSSLILSTVTGASYTAGSNLEFSTKDVDGVLRTAFEITNQNQSKFNSYVQRETFEITTSATIDHSALSSRFPRYLLTSSNGTLILPDPANIEIGTEVYYEIGHTTDNNYVITTPVATGIFDHAQDTTTGVNNVWANEFNYSGKLVCSKKNGVKYWVVNRGGTGIYNGSGTIPTGTKATIESTLEWLATAAPNTPIMQHYINSPIGGANLYLYDVNGNALEFWQGDVNIPSEPISQTFTFATVDNAIGFESGKFMYLNTPKIYLQTDKVRNTGFIESQYLFTDVSTNIDEFHFAAKVQNHTAPVTLMFSYSPQTTLSYTREVTVMNIGTTHNVILDRGTQTWQFMTLAGASSTTYTMLPGTSVRLIFDTQNNRFIIT